MFKRLIGLTLSASFIIIFLFGNINEVRADSSCLIFSSNFGVGRGSANDVSLLQRYLQSSGYLNHVPTGYFGPLTKAALQNFQGAHNIERTGFFGPLSRAQVAALTCGSGGQSTPPATSCPPQYICTPINQGGNNNQTTVILSSLNPSVVSVGSQVTVVGSGFSASGNTVKLNGGNLVTNLSSSNGNTLVFTVPAYFNNYQCNGSTCTNTTTNLNAGTFALSVTNSGGNISNSLNFTVSSTANSANNPVITNLAAPTTLSIGQTGTWTVSATDPNLSTLLYSANWGDDSSNQCPAGYIAVQTAYGYTCEYSTNGTSGNFQLSPTFTHSYSAAGTDSPTFTVRNPSGGQTETSATVVVSNSSTTGLSISSISPTSDAIGATIVINGSGFASAGNNIFIDSYRVPNTAVSNSSGTVISFVLPSSVSQCSVGNPECGLVAIPVSQGSHTISVNTTAGTSNSVNFTVTGATSLAPTATMTANGSNYITLHVGDNISIAWSSTNGVSYHSSYTSWNNVTNTSCGSSNSWVANSSTGLQSGPVLASQAYCTYTIIYTVVGATGTTNATTTVVFTVVPSTVQTGTVINAINILLDRVSSAGQTSSINNALNFLLGNLKSIWGGM